MLASWRSDAIRERSMPLRLNAVVTLFAGSRNITQALHEGLRNIVDNLFYEPYLISNSNKYKESRISLKL